ncbi:MAG: hypothetical protein KDI79_09440, partial [Anaerolineae bacterium]|nr:hypothetical protein [Anaerolineae bacterium]
HSSSPKTKRLPPLFLMMAGVMLVLLTLTLGNRTTSVWANGTKVPVNPESTRLPDEEVRAHIINSPADCAQNPYRQGEIPAGEQYDEANNEENHEIVFAEPPNPDGPVVVDLGLYIIEVTAIDVVANTFHIEGFMDLIWCDPRLAYSASQTGRHEEIYLEEAALEKIEEIWWPDIEFANEAGAAEIENEELIILPDGTINYEERFSTELEAHYDLRKFPFDRQHLEIEIESFAWDNDYLVLNQEANKIGFSTEFEIPEWEIEGIDTNIEAKQEVRDRKPFSEFLMAMEVTRLSSYYQWKIVLPLIILVAISWSVFWMIGDGLADRMSVSLTGILTIVAYQFIVADGLPKVPYFTLMDSILTLSFVMMALTIMQNIYVNTLYLHEKEELAAHWDKLCRWLFPVSYFGGLILLVVRYLLF